MRAHVTPSAFVWASDCAPLLCVCCVRVEKVKICVRKGKVIVAAGSPLSTSALQERQGGKKNHSFFFFFFKATTAVSPWFVQYWHSGELVWKI